MEPIQELGAEVTDQALSASTQNARRRMGATVLQSAYSTLSDVDQTFLLALAEDEHPCSTRGIVKRLGVDTRAANTGFGSWP